VLSTRQQAKSHLEGKSHCEGTIALSRHWQIELRSLRVATWLVMLEKETGVLNLTAFLEARAPAIEA
jgi:hypothetical protein